LLPFSTSDNITFLRYSFSKLIASINKPDKARLSTLKLV